MMNVESHVDAQCEQTSGQDRCWKADDPGMTMHAINAESLDSIDRYHNSS
jgi:hypothetical protein